MRQAKASHNFCPNFGLLFLFEREIYQQTGEGVAVLARSRLLLYYRSILEGRRIESNTQTTRALWSFVSTVNGRPIHDCRRRPGKIQTKKREKERENRRILNNYIYRIIYIYILVGMNRVCGNWRSFSFCWHVGIYRVYYVWWSSFLCARWPVPVIIGTHVCENYILL